ncbi:unnamed protein product [Paramecium sonneborni]|uniref:Uncharacterized protein n=1 Tax=Paramecium sonneborni TaxID=65129 RepID=A0A8S1M0P2_9CILI|nr:unnamed protein product [Paramecium sonneborni]
MDLDNKFNRGGYNFMQKFCKDSALSDTFYMFFYLQGFMERLKHNIFKNYQSIID